MTFRSYFLSLTILHLSLLMGQLFFGAISYYLVYTGQFQLKSDQFNETAFVIAPFLAVAGFMSSVFLTRARLGAVKDKSSLKEKLNAYRSVFITKLALLEAPSLFCIICYLLTGNVIYLAIAALIVVVFVVSRPTKTGIISDLELGAEDSALLENQDKQVA